MKIRFLVLVILTFLVLCSSNGLPTKPGTGSIGFNKRIESPVSAFTGTFSYSVPIATVTSGSISLPVSIDYHWAGNKVGDKYTPW